ncbi:MAG: nucleotidyl transferase AbiEii/AbiGii toxin family protein [Nitrospirae bacterium]|nr:nucleotidyl transferase AbiEii/AbiGii toxin family protein [Nitrospirota bacterium]
MKSIEDTLKIIQDIIKNFPADIDIALIGGYAAVLHGVERTTLDIDFCVYSNIIHSTRDSSKLVTLLIKYLPERFHVELIQGSRIHDDPFKHDVIFIEDTIGEFIRIDFLIAKYKWELDAIRSALPMEGIPIPVVTKPYLAALKLRSTGYKDAGDLVTLIQLMTEEEKEKTMELAKKISRNKKLEQLLSNAQHEEPAEDTSDELI